MNLWLALIRREWLEHRGALGWTPLAVLAVFMTVFTLAVYFNDGFSAEKQLELSHSLDQMLHEKSWDEAQLAEMFAGVRQWIALPFAAVYFGVALFVLLGVLFDERRDRTVLFWKSMPVSDTQTVLSKLITVVWLAPLVIIAAILVAQTFVFAVLSILISDNQQLGLVTFWSNTGLISGLVELIIGYVTQGFWALPLWGWLLLVSAVVPRIPFIWAVLTPLLPVLLEWAVFDSTFLFDGITNHLHDRALPIASIDTARNVQAIPEIPEILALWGTSDMWLGIATGALFVAGAIYFRRRNNEL